MPVDTQGPRKTAVLLFPKLRSRVRIPSPAPPMAPTRTIGGLSVVTARATSTGAGMAYGSAGLCWGEAERTPRPPQGDWKDAHRSSVTMSRAALQSRPGHAERLLPGPPDRCGLPHLMAGERAHPAVLPPTHTGSGRRTGKGLMPAPSMWCSRPWNVTDGPVHS